jgi:signal transduction histidine kinase
VVVGLYWRRRRPDSLFGLQLIAFGFVAAPYILHSSANSTLFTAGVAWESVIYVATLALILAFPTGRLRGLPERSILAAAAIAVPGITLALIFLAPQISGEASISGCAGPCPANAALVSAQPAVARRLLELDRAAIVAIGIAAFSVLLWRLASGTPPQRRSLLIGGPLALLFLATQATYHATTWASVNPGGLNTAARWALVGSRAAVWYGFLLALLAAEIFAGRVLRQILGASLDRRSLPDLEATLRGPLGDPSLQLAFWRPHEASWTDAEGRAVEVPEAGSGRSLTVVERDGRPAVAVMHDLQLGDDPELVQAAGAAALLAHDNVELEAAWKESVQKLHRSRARLAAAGLAERQKLERDLHDGAQQRLLALLINLALARELDDAALKQKLGELEAALESAIDELREIAHGIYPSVLADLGIAAALRSAALHVPGTVAVVGTVGRHAPEIEAAVYYSCLEGLQNALKHAGSSARVWIHLEESEGALSFEVGDDGAGSATPPHGDGHGISNVRDHLAAIGGQVEFRSDPGRGTILAGIVPLGGAGDLSA